MKKTQIKDLLRNVLKQIVSYISIILIAGLGVTAFLGIDFTARTISLNISDIYNEINFRDIEIISTKLLTPDDLKSLSGVEGVIDIEPVRYTEAKALYNGVKENAGVITKTKRINVPDVTLGRLPKSTTECAIEKKLADLLNISVGGTLSLIDPSGGTAEYLSVRDFTVTGIIKHPDHVNGTVPEIPYVLVDTDAFNNAALDGCFMKAEITIEKDENCDRNTKEYKNAVKKVIDRIETLAVECSARRDESISDVYYGEVGEKQALLDDAKKELDKARKELDEKAKELKKGEEELSDAKKLLDLSKPELDSGYEKLEAARIELEEARKELDTENEKLLNAKSELDSANKKLTSAKKELISGFNQIENAKDEIRTAIRQAIEDAFKEESEALLLTWAKKEKADPDDKNATAVYFWLTDTVRFDLRKSPEQIIEEIENSSNLPAKLIIAIFNAMYNANIPESAGEGVINEIRRKITEGAEEYVEKYRQLSDGCKSWDAAHAEYIAGLEKYNDGLKRYEDGERLFIEYENKYKEGLSEYQAGLTEYEEKKAQYEQGLKQVEEGEAKLNEGRELILKGEEEYAKGLSEYNDGVSRVTEAIRQFEAIEPCKWYVIDIYGNTSYVQITIGSDNIASLKWTFALLFVIVGVLVIFATVGKMVDEQRSSVGTQKALGFYKREIFAKYSGYGVSATLVGVLAGVIGARYGIYPMLMDGYNKYYLYDVSVPRFFPIPVIVSALCGVAMAFVSAGLACLKLLREPASSLMQPKAPPVRKSYGAAKSFTLYSRLILRNIRTDFKRVSVTVVSVAGCCALIVTGFTLRASIFRSPDIQYGQIIKYDMLVKFDPSSDENGTEKVLKSSGVEYADVYLTNATYIVTDVQVTEVLCGDINVINKYRQLNDINTGEPLFATNEGVLIQRRTAEIYGLDVNSEFDLTLGGTRTARVRVAGVFENMIGRTVVMSRGYYETVYGEKPTSNTYLVKLNGADEKELICSLKETENFETAVRADEERTLVDTSTSLVNTVVILFIFIAAVMAGVVQLNLTNIYILQKKPEMTVMRINGFSTAQVVIYVLREVVVTTILGIILGIFIGNGVSYKVLRSIEQPFVQFSREPVVSAWLIGAAMTLLFTVIVNIIALRRVKRLKLTDLT